ncbi:MAG: family 78 glycoside hydrolase catalytic domain [Tannerellaceae bacterium]
MKKPILRRVLVCSAIVSGVAGFGGCSILTEPVEDVAIVDLRCEYLTNPLGVDVQDPRLTWCYSGKSQQFKQEGFVVWVSTDSSWVAKTDTITRETYKQFISGVEKFSDADDLVRKNTFSHLHATTDSLNYFSINKGNNSKFILDVQGKLRPYQKYYWRVRTWDIYGNTYLSGAIGSFTTGPTDEAEWIGKWISDHHDKEFRPAPQFRKEFTLKQPASQIKSARSYICGLGYYEMWINGKRVGDHHLDPGYTQFDKRTLYVTYDVDSLLADADNCISILLGNGWFNVQSEAVWNFHEAAWRRRPQVICETRIEYLDGTTQIIATDESWKTATGGLQYDNLYSGDIYDQSKETRGWRQVGYNDSTWIQATTVSRPAPLLQSQMMPPIRVSQEIQPTHFWKVNAKKYIYDLGVNISGVARLDVKGKSGTKLMMRYGELLKDSTEIEQGNINVYFHPKDTSEVFQSDVLILGKDGTATFTPPFTYHGFQYVEVTSSDSIELSAKSVTGLFMHTDLEQVGHFSCSNDTLNKIWEATNRSYLSNLHGIPTDCPQREKNGWTADAHVSVDLALLNYDGIKLYEKWMNDFIDNQREAGDISGIIPSAGWGYGEWIGPVWDAAMFIIPNALYMYYDDVRCIQNIYPTCEKYLDYLKTKEHDGLLNYGLGDWLTYKTTTPNEFTSSCFYYYDNMLMARFAEVLGKDANPYLEKAKQLMQLINTKYYDAKKTTYANGSQTAQALALAMNIVPQGDDKQVAAKLADMIRSNGYHLDFGVLGSKYVPAMLAKYGYSDVAIKMITNKTAPSWASWVNSPNGSTLRETWELSPEFRDASLNHVFMGDVSAWMYNVLAGINYNEKNPGFRNVIISPVFVDGIDWVKASYKSVNGIIKSEWKRVNGVIMLDVEIPANTTAILRLPEASKAESYEDARAISAVYELNSGIHHYNIKLNQTKRR